MDILSVYLILTILFSTKDAKALQVRAYPDMVVKAGTQNTDLFCLLSPEGGDIIFAISLKAKNKTTSEYNQIATFFLPEQRREPKFTPLGQYLRDRVNLTNPTSITYKAILTFEKIFCEDDTDYMCEVTYQDSNGYIIPRLSQPSTITVTGQPAKPNYIQPSLLLSAVKENDTVSFICSGNVGRPPGRFIWIKRRKYPDTKTIYANIETIFEEDHVNCTVYGTSNLTIQLESNDNGAVLECITDSNTSSASMSITTPVINVFYAVRNVKINKNPDRTVYIAGSDTYIILDCTAEGNPIPRYTWYRESYLELPLTSSRMLYIFDATVNMSEIYVCVAENRFLGGQYNISTRINIIIVDMDEDYKVEYGLTKTCNPFLEKIIIVVSVVMTTTIFTIIGVICYRRKRKLYHTKVGRLYIEDESEEDHKNYEEKVSECTVKLSSEYAEVFDVHRPAYKSNTLLTVDPTQYVVEEISNDKIVPCKDSANQTVENHPSHIYAKVVK